MTHHDGEKKKPGKVALLTNFVAPYRVPVFNYLASQLGELRILVSTPMEQDRPWRPEWGDLDVRIQRSLSFSSSLRHLDGTLMKAQVHLPYDTFFQLLRFRPNCTISGEMGLRTLMAWLYRQIFRRSRLVIWATLSDRTETAAGPIRTYLRKLLLSGADAVMTNGSAGKRYLLSLGYPEKHIYKIGQAIDLDLFRAPPTRPEDRAHDILFVGKLEPYKGLVPFLANLGEWANEHPETHFRFGILGSGSEKLAVEAALAALPPSIEAKILDPLPYDAMAGLYAQYGVLVLPSLFEEWGLVVNEAMASGAIVLGSKNAQAVEELVEDGVTGFTFDPYLKNSSHVALSRLSDATPKELDQIRRSAQARITVVTPREMAVGMLNSIS